MKNTIPPIISAIYSYESIVARGVRLQAGKAATLAAKRNMCVGEVTGRPSRENIAASLAGIPSATIPVTIDRATNPERTQLMRATYPWVQHWRSPFCKFAYFALSNSRASIFYEYHSDFFSKKFCNDFRKDRGIQLYVLEGMNGDRIRTDKGMKLGVNDRTLNWPMRCFVSLVSRERRRLHPIRTLRFYHGPTQRQSLRWLKRCNTTAFGPLLGHLDCTTVFHS